jgi:hypothetical protein
MNLDQFGVQEMNEKQMQTTNGGDWWDNVCAVGDAIEDRAEAIGDAISDTLEGLRP